MGPSRRRWHGQETGRDGSGVLSCNFIHLPYIPLPYAYFTNFSDFYTRHSQLCAEEGKAYVFMVHAWPTSGYHSFTQFMADAAVRKVAHFARSDIGAVQARFPHITGNTIFNLPTIPRRFLTVTTVPTVTTVTTVTTATTTTFSSRY